MDRAVHAAAAEQTLVSLAALLGDDPAQDYWRRVTQQFLRDLRESGNAFYAVKRCNITRTGAAATGTSIAPRLRAECDIDLITIVDRAAKA